MILGILVLLLLGGVEHKQDITGTWQGTLQAGRDLRTVVKISKADNGGYKVVLYSIDQGGQPITANAASLEGSTFKYSITAIGGSHQGKLSADGATIVGTWTQGPKPLPLTLTRANADTAWEIPKPLAPMDPKVLRSLKLPPSSQANQRPRAGDSGCRAASFLRSTLP